MERRSFITSTALGMLSMAFPRVSIAQKGRWSEHVRPLMGTFINIAVYADTETSARILTDDCFAYLESRIAIISNWDQKSLTCQANEHKRLRVRATDSELVTLVRHAQNIQSLSKGRFNASILSLTNLWRAAKAERSLPSKLDIKHCMKEVRASGFSVTRDRLELFGASGLEFDGIGKGLIADLAAEYLHARGVRFARIACSGDIRFLGDTEWRVDIEDPRREQILGSITLRGSVAVASSGDYRNCWFVNGKRYHHLIDPTTGMPGTSLWQSTVIAPTCVAADSLAVAAFFLAPQEALKMVASADRAGAVLVASDSKVFLGQGVKFSQNYSLTES